MKENSSNIQESNLEDHFANMKIGQNPMEEIKESQPIFQPNMFPNEYYNYSQIPYPIYPSTTDSAYENQNYYYSYQMMYPQMQNYSYYYNANPESFNDNNNINSFLPRKQGNEYVQKYLPILLEINKTEINIDNIKDAKFFVIKSFEEENVYKAVKFGIWTSTQNGNQILNHAYNEAKYKNIPIYLFYSVNGSHRFIGVAEMISEVNYNEKVTHFKQTTKWKGIFKIRWVFLKDIQNKKFEHILVPSNGGELKIFSHSKDAQEIPFINGIEVLKIFNSTKEYTSILQAFEEYENKCQNNSKPENTNPQITNYKPNRGRGGYRYPRFRSRGRGRGRGKDFQTNKDQNDNFTEAKSN